MHRSFGRSVPSFGSLIRAAAIAWVTSMTASSAIAETVYTWTGAANSEHFGLANNWSPAGIPGLQDTAAFSTVMPAASGLFLPGGTSIRSFETYAGLMTVKPTGTFTTTNALNVGRVSGRDAILGIVPSGSTPVSIFKSEATNIGALNSFTGGGSVGTRGLLIVDSVGARLETNILSVGALVGRGELRVINGASAASFQFTPRLIPP